MLLFQVSADYRSCSAQIKFGFFAVPTCTNGAWPHQSSASVASRRQTDHESVPTLLLHFIVRADSLTCICNILEPRRQQAARKRTFWNVTSN